MWAMLPTATTGSSISIYGVGILVTEILPHHVISWESTSPHLAGAFLNRQRTTPPTQTLPLPRQPLASPLPYHQP
jgi:hypothetical protein